MHYLIPFQILNIKTLSLFIEKFTKHLIFVTFSFLNILILKLFSVDNSEKKKVQESGVYGNHGYGIDVNPTQQVPNTEHSPGHVNTGVEGNEVLIMNTKNEDRPTSFFAQPGILAGMLLIQ